MRGRIASLNAAVAGSVMLLEAAGQRAPEPPDGTAEVELGAARDAPPTEAAAADAAGPEKPRRPVRRRKTGEAPVGSDDTLPSAPLRPAGLRVRGRALLTPHSRRPS